VAPRGPSSLRFRFGRVAAMARSIAASARILSFNEFPALLSGLVRCSRSAPIGGIVTRRIAPLGCAPCEQ
jgi:hypothetical protein